MQNHKKEQRASNNDAQKTLPLHKADKLLLTSEIDNMRDSFTYKPHPAQAMFLALKIWEFEQDFSFIHILRRTNSCIEALSERMAYSEDPVNRKACKQQIDLLLNYADLALHILDNPCLFTYHR